mmetsp:Transcript_8384/g.18121  ORF Transcript_8384/g.18121 Transcript_8384/m.18121 type:complete len:341 (-) Transcript_8384:136-1158(-)
MKSIINSPEKTTDTIQLRIATTPIMCINPTIATASLLFIVASGCMDTFVTAFSPSPPGQDTRKTPTSKFYTNGDSSPFTTFTWDTPQQTSQQVHDPFEVWGKMRLGLGSGPGSNTDGVFWVGEGALYEAYSGKQLAIFEGFDIGKGVQLGDDHIRQLSRKIFWFRDPTTEEIMTEYESKPVRPILYDSQMIDYHKAKDGSITYSVEASLRPLKGALPKMKVTSRMAGPHQMTINVPVFLDIPIAEERGGGRYKAWEFYDFNVDPSFPSDRPPTAVWSRQGSVPPFNMDNQAVLRFSGYRVDSFQELPDRMRMEVERAYPHFKEPPRDEKEVEKIYGKRWV